MSTTDSFGKDTGGALWYPDLSRWIVETTMPCEVWEEILNEIEESLDLLSELVQTQ
jgi:hypothetical protein